MESQQNCTIIFRNIDYEGVSNLLDRVSDVTGGIQGKRQDWTSIDYEYNGSRIVFSSLVRDVPGDRFSKIVLGAHNFVRNIDTSDVELKEKLTEAILDASFIIGVAANPGFVDSDGHFDMVFAIAKELDVVIFNGSSFLDSNGRLMLDQSGASEL